MVSDQTAARIDWYHPIAGGNDDGSYSCWLADVGQDRYALVTNRWFNTSYGGEYANFCVLKANPDRSWTKLYESEDGDREEIMERRNDVQQHFIEHLMEWSL